MNAVRWGWVGCCCGQIRRYVIELIKRADYKSSHCQTIIYLFMAEAELLPHFRAFIDLIYRGYTDAVPSIKAAVIIISDELDVNSQVALQYFDHLFSLFQQLVAQRQAFEANTLAQMYDTVSNLIEAFPNLVTDNVGRFDFLIKASVEILALVSSQESEAWLNPVQGSSEQDLFDNDDDMEATRVVIGSFDKVNEAAGHAVTRKHFRPVFDHYVNRREDWRFIYASLIVASQLGEDYEQIEEFNPYIQNAILGLTHEQSRIRYAALQLISQYSIDLRPLFQENYFDEVIPPLFNILHDPVQRVVAVGFDCLNNFFDDFKDFWRIEGCVNQLLPVIVQYLKFGPTWLKEGALTALNCLAGIKNALAHRVGEILSLARELISAYHSLESFEEMVQNLYDLMTTVLCSQDRVYTENYLPEYIQIIFNYRENIDEASYILSWSRFCETYGNFTDLHLFYPLLSKLIQNQLSKNVTETMQAALSCFLHTSSNFKMEFQVYFQQVYEMMQTIIKEPTNFVELREKAMTVMIGITKDVKNGSVEGENKWFSYACNNLTVFLELLDKGLENKGCFFREVEFWLQGCNEAVGELGSALSEHHIMTILNKLSTYQYKIECLNKNGQETDGHGSSKEGHQTENDEDYEDIDSSQVDELIIQAEEDTILGSLEYIVQIYTSLLKIATPTQKSLISNFLVPIISTSITKQEDWKQFALGLAVGLTEQCSYDNISNIWTQIITLFTQFCSDSSPKIRNIATFGMGIIFQKTPAHLISDASILSSLDLISKSITEPFTRGEETSDAAKNCKDNSYATLGKLLKSYSAAYPSILTREIYSEWLSALPLNFDQQEGDHQQIFLTEVMHSNPAMLVSEVQDIVRICQIYARFAMRRTEDKNGEALLKTKQSLREISQWQLFAQSTDHIWNNLTHSQRTTISKLLKH